MKHRSTRIAEKIAAFAGSLAFLYLNALWFLAWIVANVWLPAQWRFDAYPYQALTLSVSLEAIFLSVLVLHAQNKQAEHDRKLAERDYQTNQEAEREIREMMQHLLKQDAQVDLLAEELKEHEKR